MPEASTPQILITGASGFIGSHLVEEALERGWTVYAGIRKTSSRRYLQDPRIRVFNVDLNRPDDLPGDLAQFAAEHGGFNYVVHNAGVTQPKDPADFVRGNAEFTRSFAQALRDTQPDLKKFVFIGSIAANGPGAGSKPISEDDPPRPITPYGRSKLLAEQYLQELSDLPYVVIRPAAVYGPRDEKFILRITRLFERGIEVRLGPSDQALSFIYVRDLARAVNDACAAEVARSTFLLSDGEAYAQHTFNAHVKSALGVRTLALRIPARPLVGIGYLTFHSMRLLGRPVHLSHYKMREITARNWKLDISKISQELGFVPAYSLPEGIAETIAWYRKTHTK